MTGHSTRAAGRQYYERCHRAILKRFPEQRVTPPEDVERREFSGPCFRCEASGPCQHRSALSFAP